MDPRLLAIPFLFGFEIWQLVLSNRYLGLKVIGRDADPRELGLSERTACLWVLGLLASWAWIILLLLDRRTRMQGIVMLAVTGIGYSVRRSCALKWVVVILTLEGAIRVGMLGSLILMSFFRYRGVYSLFPSP